MSDATDSPVPANFAGALDELHAVAVAVAGLSDFGNHDYLEGLRVLLAALDRESPLTEAGRRSAWDDLTQTLVARLRARHGVMECLPPPVARPIVITGVPRTGTTALHRLMSVDPQFQGLNRWLADFPMPRPDARTWTTNEHFLETQRRLDARYSRTPALMALHLEAAAEVDECLQLLRQGFTSIRFGARTRVPSYDSWLRRADLRPSYHRYAQNLALIGFQDSRRWLLKNPSHILNLELLFETFPDVVVIHTHRDLMSAIPSFCSLLMQVRLANESNVRLTEIADREVALWGDGLRAAMSSRVRHAGSIIDVHHSDFDRDPLGVIERVYNSIGLVLTREVRVAMRARIAADPERSRGSHTYQAAKFGLDRARLDEAFGLYAQQLASRPA